MAKPQKQKQNLSPILHFTALQFWKEIKVLFLNQVFQVYLDIGNIHFKKEGLARKVQKRS